jgi:MoxR-like ATPase
VTAVGNQLNGRVEDGREIAAPAHIADTRARIAAHVVGRERELELVLAAVAAGRDMLLEGPPGTSKSTLLRAITAEWGIPLVFVEGNADLTPAKLVGHHNPARVLREDYSPDNFVDGPLLEAMRSGGFLYIEEFNRAPEDTLNTLLTAMAEREVAVPRVGRVVAKPTFRVIASMNPYDNVGTTRLSTSVHDRLCRLAVTYQDEVAERGIVALRAQLPGDGVPAELADALRFDAVAFTRATRTHPDIRQGSSVRGAIDLTLVAGELLALRAISSSGGVGRVRPEDPARTAYAEAVFDAAVVALSGRIHLDETVDRAPEDVLREIWEDQFVLQPSAAAPG